MVNAVEKIIISHFGVTEEEVRSSKYRSRNVSDARHYIWYFLCGVLGYSVQSVSKEYGATDRSVQYAIHTIADAIRLQPSFARHCQEITKELKELDLL